MAEIVMLGWLHVTRDGRIFHREARALKSEGHDVTVIGRKSAISDDDTITYIDGVRLVSFAPKRNTLQERALYSAVDLFRFIHTTFRFSKPDCVLHAHEFQSALVALTICRLRKCLCVFDVHEYEPETIEYVLGTFSRTVGHLLALMYRKLEKWITKRVDGVIAVNEHLADRFKPYNPRVTVVQNYPDKAEFNGNVRPLTNLAKWINGRKVIMFVGYPTPERGVEKCLQVISYIIEYRSDVCLVVVGHASNDYSNHLVAKAKSLGIGNQFLHTGEFHYDELKDYLAYATIGIYLIQPEPIYHLWSEGTKFFQYAAAGIPVVVSDVPAYQNLIAIGKNGVTVPYNDPKQVAIILDKLLHNENELLEMGANSRRAFDEIWNQEIVLGRFLDFYKKLLN